MAAITATNPATNAGTAVSVLISGKITDPDPGALGGIAVTGVDNSHGTWKYSTDGGNTFNPFGNPNANNARLLRPTDIIQFVPNSNYSGTATITFQAWDQTSGTAGSNGNATNSGNATAFSTASATASILVNDAPTLSGANNLTTINENPSSNVGTRVSTLISGQTSDADGNTVGIAVTGVDNTNGDWQYTTDGGGHWTDFGTPSASAAVLLTPNTNTSVRFAPNTDFRGTVGNGITFQAWDQTSGAVGTPADTTANGGTTAFSTAPGASSSITVDTAPTITGTVAGQTTGDGTSISPFSGVTIGDASTPAPTLTVTVVLNNAANGQFSAAHRRPAGPSTWERERTASAARRRPRQRPFKRSCSCRPTIK